MTGCGGTKKNEKNLDKGVAKMSKKFLADSARAKHNASRTD